MSPAQRTDPEIYLDNNATTAPLPEVADAMAACFRMGPLNPSSVHRAGTQARRKLQEAREQVAGVLGALTSQVVFTSGATEANHLVLRNLLTGSMKGFQLVTNAVEHSSILEAARQLEDWGVSVRVLPVDRDGLIDLEELASAIDPGRTLVSVQWANNETGVVQPMGSIAELCQARGAVLHSDAVQAVGKLPVDLRKIPVDFLSLSGHKLHGPVGSGALVRRDSAALIPVLPGGGQESGLRPGTENLPAVVGLAVALQHRSERLHRTMAHFEALRHRFEVGLKEAGLVESINGEHAPRIPNTSSVTFEGVDGEALVLRLDQEGVRCSQSSACTNRKPDPSYVLRAMGLSEDKAFRSLRFSFSEFNTRDEVDRALDKLKTLHSVLRRFHVPAPTVMT